MTFLDVFKIYLALKLNIVLNYLRWKMIDIIINTGKDRYEEVDS